MNDLERPLQIIPAPKGLTAIFKDNNAEFAEPIAALAIVQFRDGLRCVSALTIGAGSSLEPADVNSNFERLEWR